MFGLNKLNSTVKRLNNEVSYLVKRKDELEKEIAEKQEKVDKLSYVNTEDINVRIKERDSLIEEVRNLKIEIEDYKKQKESEWIACERNFRRKKEELNNELESIRSEILKIKQEPIKINNLVVSKKKELSEIEREIENKSGILAELENEINDQRNKSTVEFEEKKNEIDRLDEIEKIIEIRKDDARKLEERRCELIKAVDTIEEQLNNKKRELEEVKQLIENEYIIEEVDVNTLPKSDFANSSLCRDALVEVREKQKDMIRNNEAVVGDRNWTVNGSRAKGKKMIEEAIKLNLKTFNNGCDYIINTMRYSTYSSSLNKIKKLYNDVNRLNSINQISISEEYLNLKVAELDLAFVYAELKEEEKEEQRRIREQMREEAKRQAELEEKRKTINKEQQHYENELKRALERNKDAELIKKLRERIAELENSKKDVDKLEATVKAGYVYIISNEGSFGENCYKIGTTRRLNPLDRVDELGNASVPFKFDVHALIFSEDCFELESKLHKIFDSKRVNKINKRKEFFNVALDEIVDVVNNQLGLNVEFTLEAIAKEYRESKTM